MLNLPTELCAEIAIRAHPEAARTLKLSNKYLHHAISTATLVEGEYRWRLTNRSLRNCLIWAARKGHTNVVARLLVDVAPTESKFTVTSLNHPCRRIPAKNRYDIDEGADIDIALSEAAEYGHADVVSLLLAAGADVLFSPHVHHFSLGIIICFEQSTRDVCEEELTCSPLTQAAAKGHLDVVNLLMENERFDKDVGLGAPLMAAAITGHDNIVSRILEVADPTALGIAIDVALGNAASAGHESTVDILLHLPLHGRAVDTRSRHRGLVAACRHGNHRIVDRLLAAGVNFIRDKADSDILIEVTMMGFTEVVELMLGTGRMMRWGKTLAMKEAASAGRSEIVSLLLAAGIHPNADNGAALTSAMQNGHSQVADLLIAAGAEVQ